MYDINVRRRVKMYDINVRRRVEMYVHLYYT